MPHWSERHNQCLPVCNQCLVVKKSLCCDIVLGSWHAVADVWKVNVWNLKTLQRTMDQQNNRVEWRTEQQFNSNIRKSDKSIVSNRGWIWIVILNLFRQNEQKQQQWWRTVKSVSGAKVWIRVKTGQLFCFHVLNELCFHSSFGLVNWSRTAEKSVSFGQISTG